MVTGMRRFRDRFRWIRAFVIIGGAACDAWMSSNALPFRRTKDLDIVLVTDALDSAFLLRFRDFVESAMPSVGELRRVIADYFRLA